MDDTAKISQIEEIMRFGWCWEEIVSSTLVDSHGSGHNLSSNVLHLLVEALREVPVRYPAEDKGHGGVIKFVDGDGVEMSEETWSDRVPSPTRGTHCRYQENVHQI